MLLLLFVVALVGWIYLYNRVLRAEDRLEQESQARSCDSDLMAALTRRVGTLENRQPAPPAEELVHEPAMEVHAPVRTVRL